MKAVVTVVGKDRVGIVYEVSKLLAEQNINIVNISQEIMEEIFYNVDFSRCIHK